MDSGNREKSPGQRFDGSALNHFTTERRLDMSVRELVEAIDELYEEDERIEREEVDAIEKYLLD